MPSSTLIFVSIIVQLSNTWAAPATLSSTIITQAGGGLPQGAPPTTLSANGISNFQLANFIENIESKFFEGVLANLSSDPAFTSTADNGISIQQVVTKVAAQEEVHKATVEATLTSNNVATIDDCTSILPITSTDEFLARANIITSISIGAIIAITASVASTDPTIVGSTTSIITVEGRHDAFFRLSASDVPNPTPFDTAISTTWAYNLILSFVVPSSCPTLPLTVLPVLTVTSPALSATAPATPPLTITFTVDPKVVKGLRLFIGWVNQANAPVYTTAVVVNGNGRASVPSGLQGTAFAALTNQNTATTVDTLTTATLAGPAAVLIS
ncbi:uncharacterized protein PAC_16665 [Phialocephala subalpina]|uniref:Uncharacterized protein n=1 Tax=Phialocephala subalpina TaxID=576137 RepID=A0A1L7XP16_9HELO|nr:uncharacterized protein PAC_16665 [Phialocephala subalpina]